MPEGDTIWRAARALQAALGGRTVTGFSSPLPAVAAAARRLGLVGRSVAGVEAKGKHLRHGALARLGPDVVADAFAAAAARARLRAADQMEIAAALLDQSRLAGIGNVYKSEVLFLCGLNPFAPVSRLDDSALDRVIATARRQMRGNLDVVSRRTRGTGPGGYWVYRRAGRPCLRCGTRIERRRQGDPPRSTYFCSSCLR